MGQAPYAFDHLAAHYLNCIPEERKPTTNHIGSSIFALQSRDPCLSSRCRSSWQTALGQDVNLLAQTIFCAKHVVLLRRILVLLECSHQRHWFFTAARLTDPGLNQPGLRSRSALMSIVLPVTYSQRHLLRPLIPKISYTTEGYGSSQRQATCICMLPSCTRSC